MDIKKLISQMTLEEKASLCSGADFWHTKAVERLGIPMTMVSDGPHGLRKQDQGGDNLGVNDSIEAVCFPAASATACSFDPKLLGEMGAALGRECQHEELSVILGPAVNIKRSPLCGRNFEYFSEDPYLASKMAAGHIKGVQSENVGTSLKHFPCNNQEYRRMSTDSRVDERALREIYLAAFEEAVKDAKPWTVMCAYNATNGQFGSENPFTLTDVLRKEWGFEGYVVSDWGAVNDRVKGLKAGLDLEMPSSFGENDKLIVKAVQDGTLDEAVLDLAVERILSIVDRYEKNKKPETVWDKEADHAIARKVASESAVLLKNDNANAPLADAPILPLDKSAKLAVIGKYAKTPRFQGGGSAHINCPVFESFMDAVKDPSYGITGQISFAQGFEDGQDVIDEAMVAEAVKIAAESDAALIFAGLPDAFESEGYDRKHMSMPTCQNHLIEEVLKVQPNVIVVLHNGACMETPWADKVKGILEMYLGGQAVGGAAARLIFGDVNPSGHLSETFPMKYEDNPSYLFFPGKNDIAEYKEGIYVGYRYYDKKEMQVRFPFGFGLSYTTFEYSDLKLSSGSYTEGETLTASVTIKNTGAVSGKAVPQLYVKAPQDKTDRPIRELKGFDKVELAPGESKTVSFTLSARAFALWNVDIHDWVVESGTYEIQIGQSSRDILLSAPVEVTGTKTMPLVFKYTSPIGDMMPYPEAMELVNPLMECYLFGGQANGDSSAEAISLEMQEAMMKDMPLRGLISFGGGAITNESIHETVKKLNALGLVKKF